MLTLFLQLRRVQRDLARMACIWTVELSEVELYAKYFDISLVPATLFFWNAQHIKVDYGW